MEGKPAPNAVLDLLACSCPKNVFSTKMCVCVANGLRCTDMCRLAECENQASTSDCEQSSDEDVEDLKNFDDY